jgi:hypothetical protein
VLRKNFVPNNITPHRTGRRAFVHNDSKRFFSLTAHDSSEESFCSALLHGPNQDVDHITVLIHSQPEILLLAVDSDEDFIPVPSISDAALSALQSSNVIGTELLASTASTVSRPS